MQKLFKDVISKAISAFAQPFSNDGPLDDSVEGLSQIYNQVTGQTWPKPYQFLSCTVLNE